MNISAFNFVFSSVIDIFEIDVETLAIQIDRHPSRIRHWKKDSKPSKYIMPSLIDGLLTHIKGNNTPAAEQNFIHSMRQSLYGCSFLNEELALFFSTENDISNFLPRLIQLCYDNYPEFISHGQINSTLPEIYMMAKSYMDQNLADDAIPLFQKVLESQDIQQLPDLEFKTIYSLGLLYKNLALASQNYDLLNLGRQYMLQASTHSKASEYTLEYGLLYKDLGILSTCLANYGSTEQTLKDAIAYHETSISILSTKGFQFEIAKVKHNIGAVYSSLGGIRDSHDYIKKGISIYENVLAYYALNPNPYFEGLANMNLGVLYCNLTEFIQASQNAKKSKSHFLKALQVLNVENYPHLYGQIHSAFAATYIHLSNFTSTQKNVTTALEYLQKSLWVFNKEEYIDLYLLYFSNLIAGISIANTSEQLEQYYEPIIELQDFGTDKYTKEKNYHQNAKWLENLGSYYTALAFHRNSDELSQLGITFYEQSLAAISFSEYPILFARTRHNYGRALLIKYQNFTNPKDKTILLTAIEYFNNSLSVFPILQYPLFNALIQRDLGKANHLLYLLTGSKEALEKSIFAYRFALEVFNEHSYPEKYQEIYQELTVLKDVKIACNFASLGN